MPAEETVEGVLAELERLVGLEAVKAQVRSVIAVVRANKARAEAGYTPVNPGLHLVFTGSPGTGKTTVARLIARLYAACGALPDSKLTEVDRSDLVAGYVGQTALRTAEVIRRSRPGVLFIDEAYALAPSHGSDFGAEAIATLVKAMEDHRHELAVIVAGYEEEMDRFLTSNPGLRSRFKTFVHFPDYAPEELTRIFAGLANEAGLHLEEATLERARAVFHEVPRDATFGNARFARSLFERAYTRMALRAAEDGEIEMDELLAIATEDLHLPERRPEARHRRIGFRNSRESGRDEP
jgi:SpoVK/Ycf46/Vps4 family AAA+-type ATPase